MMLRGLIVAVVLALGLVLAPVARRGERPGAERIHQRQPGHRRGDVGGDRRGITRTRRLIPPGC